MGVCTEPGGQGRGANLVLDSDGNAVQLSFATEPDDAHGQIYFENQAQRAFKSKPKELLSRLNLQDWDHFPTNPPEVVPMPTRAVLDRQMAP